MYTLDEITFENAAALVYRRRGPLSGAAETVSWWLFSPAEPVRGKGPIMVNRHTGELEQLGSHPKEWRSRLAEFKSEGPTPVPVPEQLYGPPVEIDPSDLQSRT